jgi:hypothetical protein
MSEGEVQQSCAEDHPEEYCRAIEAYLCRKNDGHLIRIVGPAFEQVCGWATRGVPLRVAHTGIDRYFDRYYAKGPRRRPVRVEFCEADVLDAFDEWRRAVGVPAAAAIEGDHDDAGRRRGSLATHLDRSIARLTALCAGEDRALSSGYETAIRELDAARTNAKALRGHVRQALIERLRELDLSLIKAARERCDAPMLRELESLADEELAPFRDRMPRDAYAQARQASIDRLVRERAQLPILTFE